MGSSWLADWCYICPLLSIFIFQTDISYSYGLSSPATFVSPVFKKSLMKRDILFLDWDLMFDEVAGHPVVWGHCSKHLERRGEWPDWAIWTLHNCYSGAGAGWCGWVAELLPVINPCHHRPAQSSLAPANWPLVFPELGQHYQWQHKSLESPVINV